MNTRDTRGFARDVVVAVAVVAVLYALAEGLQFQPLQIPGYLLIVGFDVLERTFGAAGQYYYIWFSLYLGAIGLVGAGVTQVLRRRGTDELPGWRLAAGSALAVVGVMAVVFGVAVLAGTGQLNPFLITGAAGAVLLVLAAVVGGAVDPF